MQIKITLPLFTDLGLRQAQYAEIECAVDVEPDDDDGWAITDCYVYDLERQDFVRVIEWGLRWRIFKHAKRQCSEQIDDAVAAAFPRPIRDENAEHRLGQNQLL